MKTVEVFHAFGTINLSAAGLGYPKDEISQMVNAKLAEGYDDVEAIIVRTNISEGVANEIVVMYVFRKYGEEDPNVDVEVNTLGAARKRKHEA